MKVNLMADASSSNGTRKPGLDERLATYLAAAASGTVLASRADAVVVSDTSLQPFGINEEVNIDFNGDGQIDWQIDHDRVNLNGMDLDYLQLDKNDVNGAANPLDVDPLPGGAYMTFPVNGTNPNNDAGILSFTNDFGDLGGYAVALNAGDMIGGTLDANLTGSFIPGTIWDFQEGSNFLGGGTYIRSNRLIDEDAGQIDSDAGRLVTAPFGPVPEYPDLDGFAGLEGDVRYLGVRLDLNDAAFPGLNPNDAINNPDFPLQHWYGWIGVRITNEDDATGEVVGWAYENELGVPILAGDTGPDGIAGDYNDDGTVNAADYTVWRDGLDVDFTPADYDVWKMNYGMSSAASFATGGSTSIPEPGSIIMSLVTAAMMIGVVLFRRRRN